MKRKNFIVDGATGKVLGVVGGVVATTQSAFAAVPTAVTETITEAVTDVGTIGAAILIVVVAVAAFNWLRKPVH